MATNWNQLKDWTNNGEVLIKIPSEIKNCPGAAAVHDIQLSQFDNSLFKPLTECAPIFRLVSFYLDIQFFDFICQAF